MTTAARTWSLLDPRPQLVHDAHTGIDLAYWHGLVMTRNQAMVLVMVHFDLWPTPLQKQRIHAEYRRAYYAGAFGSGLDWVVVENSSALPYLKTTLEKRGLRPLSENYTVDQALSWFRPSRVVKLNKDSQPAQ
jgi:hypothetical protein